MFRPSCDSEVGEGAATVSKSEGETGGVNYVLLIVVALVAGAGVLGLWRFGFGTVVQETHEQYPFLNRGPAAPAQATPTPATTGDGSQQAGTAHVQSSDETRTADITTTHWGVKEDVDPMTDKRVWSIAADRRLVNGSGHYRYQFVMKCVEHKRTVSFATFEDEDTARPIDFETRYVPVENPLGAGSPLGAGVAVSARRFTYRIDSNPATSDSLRASEYANLGYAEGLFADRYDWSNGATTLKPNPLPETRLLVSGIFPDEVVEFDFSRLSELTRDETLKACFPPTNPEK